MYFSTKGFLRIFIVLFITLNGLNVHGQDSTNTRKLSDIVSVNGYLKNLQVMSFQDLDEVLLSNTVHNRFNLKAYLTDALTVGVGMRNRIIFGDQVSSVPGYGDELAKDNGFMDLSWTLVNKDAFVMHSTLDRLYVDYVKNNIEVRIGRQRINWGLALVWNPNDLFNSYSFFDFDYEERPGTDAIRAQYHFQNGMSSLEVVADIDHQHNTTIAGMYRFNKFGYDVQILGGKYKDDIAVGTGWAGSIGNAGFKGELTYFTPYTDENRSKEAFVTTTTLDYSFANSIYINGAYLYSSNGFTEPIDFEGDINLTGAFGNLSPKNLFPTKHSAFAMASYPLSPLWNLSLSGMIGFGMNLAFVSPSISYSISDDLEALLVGQSFWSEQNEKMESLGSGVYFRLKWSF